MITQQQAPAAHVSIPAQTDEGQLAPVSYTISLADPARHTVHVIIKLSPGQPARELQLPVWNAVYQVRDFSQYVGRVSAANAAGRPLPVTKLDKTTWRIQGGATGLTVEYDVHADTPGPFGAQLNRDHAFFNFAWLLMYPVGEKNLPMSVSFSKVPREWRIASPLPALVVETGGGQIWMGRARNYDHLVDSPVEIGPFRESTFDEGGAKYRIVVDANPADYDLTALSSMLRRIVTAGVDWMRDRPFDQYTFIYHFRRSPAGGGMEHAYSTAIESSVTRLRDDPRGVAGTSAHEFFHLWNVKRIRPASLEPVDYTRENFTRALWFSEGVTSTVADYLLLRAGLTTEKDYLEQLAAGIRTLENRPAHLFQSAEESSLDAWYEKYPFYRQPERSISYYNKGEILGVLLDLAIRDASSGRKSLRDLFHWLNDNYAKKGRFFPDSEGIRQAAEALTGADFSSFFHSYVSGLEPLPYDRYFATVGLRLEQRTVAAPDPGFRASAGRNQPPVVSSVDDGSNAQRAGLQAGDIIQQLNGAPVSGQWDRLVSTLRPGETMRLRVTGQAGPRELAFLVGSKEEKDFALVDVASLTPAQRIRRAAWLSGEPDRAPSAVAASQKQ